MSFKKFMSLDIFHPGRLFKALNLSQENCLQMFFMVLTSDKEQAFFVVQKTMSLFVRYGFYCIVKEGF